MSHPLVVSWPAITFRAPHEFHSSSFYCHWSRTCRGMKPKKDNKQFLVCECSRRQFDSKTPLEYLLTACGICGSYKKYYAISWLHFWTCWLFVAAANDIESDVAKFNGTFDTLTIKPLFVHVWKSQKTFAFSCQITRLDVFASRRGRPAGGQKGKLWPDRYAVGRRMIAKQWITMS